MKRLFPGFILRSTRAIRRRRWSTKVVVDWVGHRGRVAYARKYGCQRLFLASDEVGHGCEDRADHYQHDCVLHEVGIDHEHHAAQKRNGSALPSAIDEVAHADRAEETAPEKAGFVHSNIVFRYER